MNIDTALSASNERAIAQALGVSVHTVRKWRQGARSPRREHARALVAWSHGALTFDDIYSIPDHRKAA